MRKKTLRANELNREDEAKEREIEAEGGQKGGREGEERRKNKLYRLSAHYDTVQTSL